MWALVSYMNPHRLAYGFMSDFPIAMIIALATLLAWAISKESKKPPNHPLVYILMLFTFWVSVTTVFGFSETATYAYQKWVAVMKIMLMTYVAMTMLTTRERLHAMVWVIVISLGYYGLKGGLFTALGGGGGRVYGPPDSVIADNNHLAVALIMLVPLIRYLQVQSQNKWVRMALIGLLAATGLSIIGSFSRGAFLAGSIMMLYFFIKSRHKVMIGLAGVAIVATALSIMPQHYFDRMQTIKAYDEDASASGRLDAWTYAYRVANNHLLGGGFKSNRNHDYFLQLVPEAPDSRAFHSIYFEVLGDHGWIGLALFLVIGFMSLTSANVLRRSLVHRPDLVWAYDLASMCQVSLIGFAAGGAFLNLAFFDLFYNIIALIVCLQFYCAKVLLDGAAPARGGRRHAPAVGRRVEKR